MQFVLGVTVLVLNFLDNATTYACLHKPIAGFDVFEANPMAAWLFDKIGLFEGLLVESLITTGAIIFLVVTTRITHGPKVMLLFGLALLPGIAVINNLQVMDAIGVKVLP